MTQAAMPQAAMTQSTTGISEPGALPRPVPLADIWPWILFVPVLLFVIYMVGAEEGATSLIKGMYVHEFVHDARHLLGFPCH